MLSGIVDTLFNVLKVSVVIAVAAIFMVAIHALLSLISTVVLGGIISEIFALISMYLPFNAVAVFGALGEATIAILAFLVAKKIFDLTSWSISAI